MIINSLYGADTAVNGRCIDISLENVLESFAVIEKSLYETGTCNKSDLKKASTITESFIQNSGRQEEKDLIENRFRLFAECYHLSHTKPVNEWFRPTFQTFDDVPGEETPASPALQDRVTIQRISPHTSRSGGKNYIFKDGRIFAGKRYSANDIIEEAPIRIIHVEDTYSRPIRDLTFEVDGEKGLYAIPFGYASYYRIDEASPMASYDFTYDPKTDQGYVIIRALKPIMKNDEITIIKDRNKFAEQKYDRFRADNGRIREVPVSNFRFN